MAFGRVWYVVFLHKRLSSGFFKLLLQPFSSFRSNRWPWVVLGGKSLQKYLANFDATHHIYKFHVL